MDSELMFDCTDLADWELSVEVELTKRMLPSLEETKQLEED